MCECPRVFAAASRILLALSLLILAAAQPLLAADSVPPPSAAQHPAAAQAQANPPVAPAQAKPPSPPAQVKPAASPAPAKPATPPPPPKIVLDNKQVFGILGKEVLDAGNEKMGRIIDVLVDRAGIVRAAIIDFGGFLGVGSRKIAVDWSALHFGRGKDHNDITLELTRDQVKAAPQFEEGKPITVLGGVGTPDLPQVTSRTPER